MLLWSAPATMHAHRSLIPNVAWSLATTGAFVAHLQAAELRLPRVVGRARHTVLAGQYNHHGTRLGVLQDADDLLV